MKILIVDDSVERSNIILDAVERCVYAKFVEIEVRDTADSARLVLSKGYDLLILDLLIPKKRNGVPQAAHSTSLLADICSPKGRYVRPGLIIGLTADLDGLQSHREKFFEHAAIVLDGTLHKRDWLDKLIGHIGSLLGNEQRLIAAKKNSVLVTVHGIRTYGTWQRQLAYELNQYSDAHESIDIKYGFFDILSFAAPFSRRRKSRQIAERLKRNLENVGARDVYIVAHSFGTLIVSEALRAFAGKKRLKGVILCGSPLPHDYNIDHIINASEQTINDCGTRDFVLIAARLLLLGLGDAGRVGFVREDTGSFMNRYFAGGHGLYFRSDPGTVSFFEKHWLKFLALSQPPRHADCRRSFVGQDIVHVALNVLTALKPCWYGLLAIAIGRLTYDALLF